jgi:GDPmannose 4,6-dehydratase
VDPKLLRPAEVEYLCGDSTKAREHLTWDPEVNFKKLIELMVDSDLELVRSSPKAAVATSN